MIAAQPTATGVQFTAARDGRVFQGEHERFRCLLTSDKTGGVCSMFEITVQPGGNAPLHLHHHEDETFYVLEGTMEAHADGRRLVAGPGDTVHFPPGVAHAFRALGDRPLKAVLLLHPGGTEAFYERMCALIRDRADIEAFNDLSLRHGIEVLGPCPD